FSSHLLPDVEAVCDHVVVLGAGKLLAQGKISEMKQLHSQCFEVRVKADPAPFAQRLRDIKRSTEVREDLILVRLPDGQTPQLIWKAAADNRQQIRNLRPQRSTLEEVFLKAVEQS